ncbi:hypothetical protein V1279_004967 [Bradyrhizobium sp. AZCC 1610]
MAYSDASEPLFTKNARSRSPGASSQSLRANFSAATLLNWFSEREGNCGRLVSHLVGDLSQAVTEVRSHRAAQPVEIAAAVGIEQIRPLAAINYLDNWSTDSA